MTIEKNVNLKSYNTFGISVIAKYFTVLRTTEEAKALFTSEIFKQGLTDGGGSNLLFTKDYEGLVIKSGIKGRKIVAESEETVSLEVGSGENWHELVMYCVARNWGGIENLALIPGTAGAAPIQNIGAYGVEIKKIISGVETIEISSGISKVFSNSECHFGYRESILNKRQRTNTLFQVLL
jgi:UDP-N-acetylmuramate dehydrogenase